MATLQEITMTKRGMDNVFEFLCQPRTIIWSFVWCLIITTAIVVVEVSK